MILETRMWEFPKVRGTYYGPRIIESFIEGPQDRESPPFFGNLHIWDLGLISRGLSGIERVCRKSCGGLGVSASSLQKDPSTLGAMGGQILETST